MVEEFRRKAMEDLVQKKEGKNPLPPSPWPSNYQWAIRKKGLPHWVGVALADAKTKTTTKTTKRKKGKGSDLPPRESWWDS